MVKSVKAELEDLRSRLPKKGYKPKANRASAQFYDGWNRCLWQVEELIDKRLAELDNLGLEESKDE